MKLLPILIILLMSLIVTGVLIFGYHLPLQDVAVKVGLVAGIVTGVGVIFTKVLKPLYIWVRDGGDSFISLTVEAAKLIKAHRNVDLPKLDQTVASILAELRPNGGSSVRDAINRIEDRVVRADQVTFAVRQDGPFGIFICDKNGKNREVNRRYCRWIGVGADELLGHGWRNYIVRDDHSDELEESWNEAFAQGREVEFIMRMKTTHGEVITVDIKAHPIHNRMGEVTEYIGVLGRIEQ